jgi:plastocyanin domain-containing protein
MVHLSSFRYKIMMNYIKRRFSSGESTDDVMNFSKVSRQSAPEVKIIPDIDVSNLPNRSASYSNQQTGIELSSKEKSKLLFVIDNQYIDW